MLTFNAHNHTIKLKPASNVFKPTLTTRILLKQVKCFKDKTVLDLGCGLGPVAIAAALNRAKKVFATDIMTEAFNAAKKNVQLNHVQDAVEVCQGDLFESVKNQTFDIIIDDVSGMAEDVSRISSWYPQPIPTGGKDGTEPTLRMLQEAGDYLNEDGYLLFPVISLSKKDKIIKAAQDIFGTNLELLKTKIVPFNKELMEHIDMLEKQREAGIIQFEKKRSRYMWTLSIYKATKP